MSKMNQIVAVEAEVKAKAEKATAQAYKDEQKTEPLKGIARNYRPFTDEESERLPSESTKVQIRVADLNARFRTALVELFDLIATKDWGNTVARADVVVNGVTLYKQAPVTFLLFLEKEIAKEIRPYIADLPVLDVADEWAYDPNADAYATHPVQTVKTRKVMDKFVKAEATKEHPAQVEVFHVDVPVGIWTTTRFSGAIPQKEKTEMLARVDEVSKAVKMAREEGNSQEVQYLHLAAPFFDYIFEGSGS